MRKVTEQGRYIHRDTQPAKWFGPPLECWPIDLVGTFPGLDGPARLQSLQDIFEFHAGQGLMLEASCQLAKYPCVKKEIYDDLTAGSQQNAALLQPPPSFFVRKRSSAKQ